MSAGPGRHFRAPFARPMDPPVVVTVDTRERDLFRELASLLEKAANGKVRLESKQLDAGDIHIASEHSIHIIERKTFSDGCASLNGGRLAEQSARASAFLKEVAGDRVGRFTYLIETREVPSSGESTYGVHNVRLFEALEEAACRDSVPALWASCVRDSAHQVLRIALKAATGSYDLPGRSEKATVGYAALVKHSGKRKNMDDNASAIMLTTVSGLSATTAAAIVREYPSAPSLVRAYNRVQESERALLLENLEVKPDRRLGPKLSRRLAAIFGTQ